MKAPLKIWFTNQGDMLDTAGNWCAGNSNYKSEDDNVFSDSLEFFEMATYYPRVWLKSTNSGRKYCMMLTDFEEVIKAKLFNDNTIRGDFKFTKKGQAQGIKLLIAQAP